MSASTRPRTTAVRRAALHERIRAARAGGVDPTPLEESWLWVCSSGNGRVLHTDADCRVARTLTAPVRGERRVGDLLRAHMCTRCSTVWLAEQWATDAHRLLDARRVIDTGAVGWEHLVELRRIQTWPDRARERVEEPAHPWQVGPVAQLDPDVRAVARRAGAAADAIGVDWARWADAAAGWFDTIGRITDELAPLDQYASNTTRSAYHQVTWAGGSRADARAAGLARGRAYAIRHQLGAGTDAALEKLLDAVDDNFDRVHDTTRSLVLMPDLDWGDRRVEWLCAPARRWFPRGTGTWGVLEVPGTVARWLTTYSGALRPRRPDRSYDEAVQLSATGDVERCYDLAWQLFEENPSRPFDAWWDTAAAVLAA